MEINETLDCKGLSCPLPMLNTAKADIKLKSVKVVKVLTTDPGSKVDISKWCVKNGHTLLEESEEGAGVYSFLIQKK